MGGYRALPSVAARCAGRCPGLDVAPFQGFYLGTKCAIHCMLNAMNCAVFLEIKDYSPSPTNSALVERAIHSGRSLSRRAKMGFSLRTMST